MAGQQRRGSGMVSGSRRSVRQWPATRQHAEFSAGPLHVRGVVRGLGMGQRLSGALQRGQTVSVGVRDRVLLPHAWRGWTVDGLP